jgi:hypothetical protein
VEAVVVDSAVAVAATRAAAGLRFSANLDFD